MDLRDSVLPRGKDILKYCFNPSKVGKIGGSNSIKMTEQVAVIHLISCKLCKLQICYIHYQKDILQSF